MVSDVAHELRTPLTNLVGLLEAVEDGLREPDPATLGSLREEVGLLERLVEDLQEIAVADAGQLTLEIETVDVLEEARSACAAFESARAPNPIEVESGGGVSTQALLARTDRRRLSQILRNLLRNAMTHSPPDGTIRLSVRREGDAIRVSVSDRGPGIAPEHRELVWERFYRVESSRDRASGGMGLGLPIVKRLVAALGGEVGIDSVVGEGATFWFTLPAA
jgi:two-component system sensor histidine kinase BaeS